MAAGVAQLNHLVSQQTHRPARRPLWRIATRQHGQPGFDFAGELGWRSRPPLVIQSGPQPTLQEALAYIAHRALTAQDRIGNFLVRVLLGLATVAQQQDMRSGIGTQEVSHLFWCHFILVF